MRRYLLSFLILLTATCFGQGVVDSKAIAVGNPNGKEAYEGEGKSLYNINESWLEIYPVPKGVKNTGICVVIAPGGIFQYLAKEGVQGRGLAKDLNERGVTAVILNYKVLTTKGEDPYEEVKNRMKGLPLGYFFDINRLVKNVRVDALWAIKYMRENAVKFGIDVNKVGIVGFSAGGSVAFSTVMGYKNNEKEMPNFVAGGSPYILPRIRKAKLPEKEIPMFISVSEGDEYGIEKPCKKLIKRWKEANYKTEGIILPLGGGHDVINYREKAGGWLPNFLNFVLSFDKK